MTWVYDYDNLGNDTITQHKHDMLYYSYDEYDSLDGVIFIWMRTEKKNIYIYIYMLVTMFSL